jgi:hypothetical protein
MPLQGDRKMSLDAFKVASAKIHAISLLERGKQQRFYCRCGRHYVDWLGVKFDGEGRVKCKVHGQRVKILEPKPKGIRVQPFYTGELMLCQKPYPMCGFQWLCSRDGAAVVFCLNDSLKECLLVSPQKQRAEARNLV